MSYIWNDYSVEKQYSISQGGHSPYLEAWNTKDDKIFVNVCYRFRNIFFPDELVKENNNDFNELVQLYSQDMKAQAVVNYLFHYLAQLDMEKGFSKLDFAMSYNEFKIKQGFIGTYLKNEFDMLRLEDREIILRYMSIYDEENQRKTMFDTVLYHLFDKVAFYYEESSGLTYIYISNEPMEYNKRKYLIAEYIFKDLTLNVEVIWKNHFGILEVDKTMIIDNLALL